MSDFSFYKPSNTLSVMRVASTIHSDDRGYFLEAFRHQKFDEYLEGFKPIVQENLSFSKAGTLRGLHVQVPPQSVGKLVVCLSGDILDVAVDVRPLSPTYKKYISAELNKPHLAMWIPPGYAHGFYARTDALVLYRQTDYYNKWRDRTIKWSDSDIGIDWELLDNTQLIMSEKDKNAQSLVQSEKEFETCKW